MSVMRQSQLFTKTRKEAPKDEVSKNAQLLIRAGFIHKEMAGVYDYLPLGLRVISKIQNIIREEMNKYDGQEVTLTALQDKKVWEKTDRWDDKNVDVWFKTKLHNETELGLGFTHEEPLTNLLTNFVHSYKDLPLCVYQFQNKFRNELRSKSGIMRGREFLMKDLYSFSRTQEEHDAFYEKMHQAYIAIFDKVGLGEKTYYTVASGGSFGPASHEFQTVSDSGEDKIFVDEDSKIAINEEVYNDETIASLGLDKSKLKEMKSIEVGNIFPLGTKFSEPLELNFMDENGKPQIVIMGCYGIGLGRLMGTVVEELSDEKGIVWPESIAPFDVHLINVSPDNAEATKTCDEIYQSLTDNKTEVLYDDRDARGGEKFADADLIGIPYQIVVGAKSLDEGLFEVKRRSDGKLDKISKEAIINGHYRK